MKPQPSGGDSLFATLALMPVIMAIFGAVLWLFAGSAILLTIKNNPLLFLGIVGGVLLVYIIRMRRG